MPTPNDPTIGDANANAGPPTTTPSTVTDQIQPRIPNPIPADSPASVGVTPQVPPAQQAQPKQATPPARPQAPQAPDHGSIFKSVLGMLSGGMNRPQMDANGNPQVDANGRVQMKQSSTKQLGAGILAGALSSMIAGMAAPTQYTTFGEGRGQRKVADYGASAAAGAAAAQPFTQEGSKAKAQGQADEERGRA